MNIGEFKVVNGRTLGWIATRTIDLPQLGLRPVESEHERAPLFEILALNVGNRWVQVGALWEAVARNSTGEAFLQGSIDDPSLSEPLSIALFGNEEDGFRVAWRRQQPRDVFAPVIRGGQRRDGGGDVGFGESTAAPGGDLVGAGAGFDDEIAF
ncbi:DUF736 domain-containing protein (plasmid) [Novosphingobium resinovorum]|uniref:DUF736 domain-containing protein n=1 Tax=Novosphingobium resinovorum TaxID=158500 RepID=A0A1D8AFF6_9SPHN|nr:MULTISPECIES: DUF736 domain-containing protein [Sphingomonadaceae]AOR80843.1 hypothetical protein BES08_29015 [Novosphingobium resinovorum]EJU13859.1 hypothetical protein LH128_06672 [Sphingomonas sp. LH128]MBF7015066.1 DUF736 domain-containing protein [Novosphingobium sp. HR1a]WJM29749.1 DUF736 domain-containing protein [Novosphingobium resinovorum]